MLTPTGGDERLEQEILQALSELSHVDDIAIVECIIKIIRTGDELARKKAIFFLASQENESVIRRFLGYLIESEWWVRERVVDCLGHIHSRAFDHVIIDYLEVDRDEMRGVALDVVGKRKKREAVDSLLNILDKCDYFMRDRVIAALRYIGDRKAVPFITAYLQVEESRWADMEALGDPASFEVLTKLWKDSSWEEKVTIADALCKIDEHKAAKYLKQFIFDEDPLLRKIITSTLTRGLETQSIESLTCLLLLSNRPDDICKRLAGLIRDKSFEVIDSVIDMLIMENPKVCGELVGLLVETMSPEKVKELMSFIASIDFVERNRLLDSLLRT